MSGQKIRRRLLGLEASAPRERVDHKQGRLRELGEAELIPGIVDAQFANRVPEQRVGRACPIREPIEEIGAHAFGLRTLPGKETNRRHAGETTVAPYYPRWRQGRYPCSRARCARTTRTFPRSTSNRALSARCAGSI